MLKRFDENFSGWGTVTADGVKVGFEGYSYQRANTVANIVRQNMMKTRGIREINVSIIPLGNDKYRVVNTSTYESDC